MVICIIAFMNVKRLTLAIGMQGILIAAYAQDPCDQQLVRHGEWKEAAGTQWNLELKSSGKGSLFYYGARHADEPADPQFAEISAHFDRVKPTVVFYEGPDRGIVATGPETITRFGESGYIRFLASRAGIRSMPLEPAFPDTYGYLISRYPQEQVDIYMLSKEAMRLRTRKDYTREQIVAEIGGMLKAVGKMLGRETAIGSVEALDQAFTKYWGNKLQWWEAPQDWFDPHKQSSETGGIFTNEINALSSDFRDIHMYRVLAEQVNRGERVMAVVGRNHVPLQAPALKCAIK